MKKFIVSLTAVLMAAVLAACSGAGSQGTTAAGQDSSAAEETTAAEETSAEEETNVGAFEGSLWVGAGSGEIVFDEAMFPVEGFSGEIHTNPYVRTLIIEDVQTAVIVSLELVNTPEDIVDSIKEYVSEKTGAPKDNVWVHSNHTITTPHAPEDETQRALFVDSVMTAATKSIDDAALSLKPAAMGIAVGECDANINKDIELNDGWYIGSNPDRYSDKTMTVIRFDDAEGNPIAIYYNYGMKPTTIDNTGKDDNIRKISADCTGLACTMLEEEFGCPAMFVMPATGDQQAAETTTYYEWDEENNEAKKIELSVEEGIELSDKYGKMIAESAIELANSAVCDIDEAPVLTSFTTFNYENAAGDGEVAVDVSAMTIGDDIAFVGIKSELNAITGHQLAEQSPYKYTMVTGFLNGDQKYMPDEEAYEIESWEFKRSGFGKGCAEEFVNQALTLLNDLKQGVEHKKETASNTGNADKNYEVLDIAGMKWLVLDDRDGKQLVITEQVIGNMAFKAAGGDSTWEDSDLRTYLNGEFYESTFSDDEKARIEETNTSTPANSKYGITGGNDTTDRIFVLSAEEAEEYLEGSEYLIATDASGNPAWYHLRTMGEAKDVQACVNVNGEIDLHGPDGGVTNAEGGIRPVMWIRKY